MMAGVMAHEMSHVALRHATAQATETQKYQVGSILGQIAGAVIGGGIGQVVAAGSQIGFGAGALKYSRGVREAGRPARRADNGARRIRPARPRDMFQKIQSQGGSGGPEWLSSHPNPGNRDQYIMQEASMLRVEPGAGRDNGAVPFHSGATARLPARAHDGGDCALGPALPESGRRRQQYPNDGNYPNDNGVYARGERVAYPSTRYQTQRTNLFSVAVPSNWRQIGGDQSSVSYAPEGAYGSQGITHGVMFGVAQSQSNDLQSASRDVVNSLVQGENSYLRQATNFQRSTLGGRQALATTLTGRSPLTGRNERVTIVTTQFGNGQVFYMAAVSPQDEYSSYQRAFNDILRSLQLNTRY
jgi:hypothetical protein